MDAALGGDTSLDGISRGRMSFFENTSGGESASLQTDATPIG
ncbi:MAG: hypothetical protein ACFB4I_08455 [Cyanophyceae cyanobacterium]